jgi:hypothetical protein
MPRTKKYDSGAEKQAAYRQRREDKRAAQATFQASVVCAAWRLARAVRKAAAAGDGCGCGTLRGACLPNVGIASPRAELRLLAKLTGDAGMISAMPEGRDLLADIARQLYSRASDAIWRSSAGSRYPAVGG